MARPDTLIPGNCYFLVNFYDRELLFPSISTLKYIGCETDEQGRSWLFEEPVDPPEGEEEAPEPQSLIAFTDDQLYQIVDFDGLATELREMAADHPLQSVRGTAGRLAESVPTSLKENVERFLRGPEFLSLTITILYTDDGLSLGRRTDGSYEIGFVTHPRRGMDEEQKLRSLFAGLQSQPHADYLTQGGRTRVLEFPAPQQLEALLHLCDRVLIEIHKLRADDFLKYSFLKKSEIR